MSNLQRALEYSGIRTVRDTAGQGFQVLDRAGEAFGNTVFEAAGGINGMARATLGVGYQIDAVGGQMVAGALKEIGLEGWSAEMSEWASGRKSASEINFELMDQEVRATEHRLRAQYLEEASSRGINDQTQQLYYAETRLREMTFAYRAREDAGSLSGDRQSGASGSTLHAQLGDQIAPEAKAWIDEVAGGANYGEYGTWSDNAPPMPASMEKGPSGEGLTITITKDARDIAQEEGRPGPGGSAR